MTEHHMAYPLPTSKKTARRKGSAVWVAQACFGAVMLLSVNSCQMRAPVPPHVVQDLETAMAPADIDLDSIRRKGRLVALMRRHVGGFDVVSGRPQGYEYELLQLFAERLGVDLEVRIANRWTDLERMLLSGEGDIIAANVAVTKERTRNIRFGFHHSTTRQVLVQRKPEGWRAMSQSELEGQMVRDAAELVGKTVHVPTGSPFHQRLLHLSEELGGDVRIAEAPEELAAADLVNLVADGTVSFTVANENTALRKAAENPDLDVRTVLSLPQRVAWGFRPNADSLVGAAEGWARRVRNEPRLQLIYGKYRWEDGVWKRRGSVAPADLALGRLSPYDDLFRRHGRQHSLDWRLLASMAYQESQFDPTACSPAGAVGVMQLLPETARELGVVDLLDPHENIRAGTMYVDYLTRYWKGIPDKKERLKFILASYNAGVGHVQDARRLAEKYGKNPDVWDGHVAEFILKKAMEPWYMDEVVRHGYCRGQETYRYVSEILRRFEVYRELVI